MRIHFKTSGAQELVPFDYQEDIVRCMHKWIGHNQYHDDISIYSFSMLSNAKMKDGKLCFENGSYFSFSSWDNDMIKRIIKGVQDSPGFIYGMKILEITIEEAPDLMKVEKFYLSSPVLIKRTMDDKVKFYYHSDKEAGILMEETIKSKMKKAGLEIDDSLEIRFDKSYLNPRIKKITYKGIENKASLCPVIIKGKPETKAFIWNVGLGNSTGIGFGAIK